MATFSAIDYYYGITSSASVNIFGGKYTDCSICNAFISDSKLQNCDLDNDFVQKTIVIDTKFTESIIKDSDIELWASKNFAFSYFIAEIYALLDEKEKAMDWIENSVSRGGIGFNYPFINHYDPFFINVRGEERFKKLMEKVKYEWEHFEV